tara:strand:+ start:45227 stop:46933 length:1707 start_codon:yes stop_codon:yes gene_type:complete
MVNPVSSPTNFLNGYVDGIDFDKSNIENIKSKTAEKLEALSKQREERDSSSDILTSNYTQDLIEGGILPGTEGYVSATQKDADRRSGDLAIQDYFSEEEMAKRNASYENILRMNDEVAADRRAARQEEIFGDGGMYEQMIQKRNENAYGSEKNPYASILDYMPEEDPRAVDKDTNNNNDNDNGNANNAALPELIDRPEGDPLTTELYNAATNKPEFNKDVSFDGRDFDYFLQRAQSIKANIDPDDDEGGTTSYASILDLTPEQRLRNEYTYNDPNKADLYQRLQAEGLSDDDMLKAAQSAGLTNVRTGEKGMDDFNQIIDAYNKGFYEGDEYGNGSLKSEQDLIDWYNSQGDDLKNINLKKAQKKAGYETYDNEEDAQKLMEFLGKKLQRQGIAGEPNKKDMKAFNKQMNKLDKMFGNTITYKEYKNALKDNKASDVNSWMKDYMELGGGVGKRVQDKIGDKNKMPSNDLQDSVDSNYFQGNYGNMLGKPKDVVYTTEFIDSDGDSIDDRFQAAPGLPQFKGKFGMKDYDNALNVINDPKAVGDYMLELKSKGIDFRPKLTDQFIYLR